MEKGGAPSIKDRKELSAIQEVCGVLTVNIACIYVASGMLPDMLSAQRRHSETEVQVSQWMCEVLSLCFCQLHLSSCGWASEQNAFTGARGASS